MLRYRTLAAVDNRTSIERLWDEMKIEAAKWAASDEPAPEPADCEGLIRKMARGMQLPDDIIRFYASEFSAIIREKRERLGDVI